MARASHKGMGPKGGVQHVGDTSPEAFDQDDLASEINQARSRNERQSMPGEKRETEGLIESFEKLDPKAGTNR
jgi:hypothetical protein